MAEAVKATFKFEEFRIPNFFYNESPKGEATLNISIIPKGIYSQGKFDVELELTARDEDDLNFIIIHVKCIATFRFDERLPLNEVPSYFYKNSIAITFPYIRAFISNLTLQSNTGLIILDLMNLTNLEEEFRNSISEITV